MSEAVVLTGPFDPADCLDLLDRPDAKQAVGFRGYRGIPTSELARALIASGRTVEVVTCGDGLEGPLELSGPKLRVLVAPRRPRARALASDFFKEERRTLGKLLAQTEGGLIHAHWTYEFAWAALDSRRRVLVTAHDAPLTILHQYRDAYRLARTLMAYVVRARIRHLTAVSPYLAERWRREMLYRRPIDVVPNIARTLPSPAPVDRQNGVLTIVDVADASRGKNLGLLCAAGRVLRDSGRPVRIRLIGPGLDREGPFASRMRRLDLAEGVEFQGVQSPGEIGAAFADADIFVHPSREECCPVSVIEAMNAGKPVVVAEGAGGGPWVVDHGRAGVVADISSPTTLARTIVELADDERRRASVTTRARRRVEEMFSPEAVVARYEDVYAKVRAA